MKRSPFLSSTREPSELLGSSGVASETVTILRLRIIARLLAVQVDEVPPAVGPPRVALALTELGEYSSTTPVSRSWRREKFESWSLSESPAPAVDDGEGALGKETALVHFRDHQRCAVVPDAE